jgi:hypothetical protein
MSPSLGPTRIGNLRKKRGQGAHLLGGQPHGRAS